MDSHSKPTISHKDKGGQLKKRASKKTIVYGSLIIFILALVAGIITQSVSLANTERDLIRVTSQKTELDAKMQKMYEVTAQKCMTAFTSLSNLTTTNTSKVLADVSNCNGAMNATNTKYGEDSCKSTTCSLIDADTKQLVYQKK